MSVALLEFVGEPENRLGTHFCAKVSVKGGWRTTLWTERSNDHLNVDAFAVLVEKVRWTDLLHVAKNVLTTVEDALALL